MKLLFRIYFWFTPNEKPMYVHAENDSITAIKAAFLTLARERYPTTYDETAKIELFSLGSILSPRKQLSYVGNPAGTNAKYDIKPVLEINGRYFELTQLTD